MKKKLISSGAVQIFGFVFGGWLFITSIKLQVKINGDVRKKISRQKKSQLDRNNSKNEEKVDFKRCGVNFWLGFRWPTFNYLDQTTRQDQWGREKKKSQLDRNILKNESGCRFSAWFSVADFSLPRSNYT